MGLAQNALLFLNDYLMSRNKRIVEVVSDSGVVVCGKCVYMCVFGGAVLCRVCARVCL